MLSDNARSESYLQGNLRNAHQASVVVPGKTDDSFKAKYLGPVDEFHIGRNFRMNFINQGGI